MRYLPENRLISGTEIEIRLKSEIPDKISVHLSWLSYNKYLVILCEKIKES